MRWAVIGAAALALTCGTAASAQTTDCSRTLTGFSCDTSPAPPSAAAGISNFFAGLAMMRARQQAAAVRQAVIEQFKGDLDAGRCDDARALLTKWGGDAAAAKAVNDCESPAQRSERIEQGLRAEVATAVREGRCNDAKALALAGNRLDMADQAMRVCTPQ